MLTVALQQGINGLVLGSLYVLVALGLTLIYGVLVQINFAHADIVTLGAFSSYFFTHALGGGYLPSIVVALLVGAVPGQAEEDGGAADRIHDREQAGINQQEGVDDVAHRRAARLCTSRRCDSGTKAAREP